jgi:hypothetical protein
MIRANRRFPLAKSASIAVGVVGLGAAAALFVIAQPQGGGQVRPEVEAVAGALDAAVREAGATVHSRAQTLAELPRLAAAVSTDETTVRDLTTEELAFRPHEGETITIAQLMKGTAPTVLLQIPEKTKRSVPLGMPGQHLFVDGNQLYVCDVVMVQPKERADELTGVLAVSSPIELTAIRSKLDAVAGVMRLEVPGGAALTLGNPSLPIGAHPSLHPIASEAGKGSQVAIPFLTAAPNAALEGGAAVAAFGALIIAGLLWRRKKAPVVVAPTLEPSKDFAVRDTMLAPGTTPSPNATPRPSQEFPSLIVSQEDRDKMMGAEGSPRTGRFSIIRQLGSGGMADVYLARAIGEAGFEKKVALKVMHKDLAAQPIIVQHFLDEARLASRLTHPNIVQILDLGKAGDEYFIAMELIDGADLERLMEIARERGIPIPPKVGMTILRKICDGLHAAHIAVGGDGKPLDLVHRDVKAANVFVDRNGAVKVGDFGIAKANEQRRDQTEIGQVKGTAAYMAPEHRLGQAVDRRADLFAVGAIGYEVLTGTEANLDLMKLAQLGRAGWPHLPHLAEVRPELPAELEPILWKAMAYERTDRYDSCAQLEEALEAVASKHNLIASDKAVARWVDEELSTAPQTKNSTA